MLEIIAPYYPVLSGIFIAVFSALASFLITRHFTLKSIKAEFNIKTLDRKKELLNKFEEKFKQGQFGYPAIATYFGRYLRDYQFAFPDLVLKKPDILSFDSKYHERLFDFIDINIFELVQVGANYGDKQVGGFPITTGLFNAPNLIHRFLIEKMVASIKTDVDKLRG